MFTGLRARLLLSYLFLILLTLLVITVALFLVLRTRPLASETTILRLYNLMNQVDIRQTQGSGTIAPNGPTRLQQAYLRALDKRLGVRIILADNTGKVSFDSRRGYEVGSQLNLESTPYVSPVADDTQFPMIYGTLHNPDGSNWIFVGQAPSGDSSRLLFYVANREPSLLSVPETLQYYGSDLLMPLLQAGLIGLVVALIMSLVITRWIARPLQDVEKVASAAAGGQLDKTAPVRGPREVRTVAEAFNHMTQEVRAAQNAQRDFLANVTHDLRTPLTSIQGFSQAIIDGVASNPAAAQRAAQIIHDEAGRLNRMVQELLDLARIEAGRFRMTRHSVRLTDILLATGERLTPRATEKGLTLTVDVPQLPLIAGDGDRLVQVFTNLIDNAIKHTPEGGTVLLRAAQEDNGILVQVRDNGEGIPAADLPHIFDRFYQVDKSRHRERRDGVGLGLTITKGIVEAHGGRLWVVSKEGEGTAFSAWFPAVASDASTISVRRRSGIFKTPPPKPIPERHNNDH
jgi:signal transduction histidine kinase